MNKHFTPILTFVLISLGAGVLVAHAQGYAPLAPLPGTYDVATGKTDISAYLSGALKLLIALGGATAILMAIVGGTQYVASGIAPAAKNDAKDRITNAFIGLALVLTSYLILNSINPKLIAFNLMLPSVRIAVVPAGSVTPGGTGVHVPIPPIVIPSASSIPYVWQENPPSATGPVADISTTSGPATSLIDQTNDYSIIMHCVGDTSYPLCVNTDLNKDGKKDLNDTMVFLARGNALDVNKNRTLELANSTPAAATSCFFKTSTANIQAMLPHAQNQYSNINGCSGNGITIAPTVACGGSAGWLKYSVLGSACAVDSGLLNMPFGYVYGATADKSGYFSSIDGGVNGQFGTFKAWASFAASGNTVNLPKLFLKTFLNKPQPFFMDMGQQVEPYLESNLGKITYATIAQYDLNNDGIADFSAGGADLAGFASCNSDATSKAVVTSGADFNQDGVIDCRDLSFANFMRSEVLGGSGLSPVGSKLNWFESRMFDPTGYTDKQIINYCIGRKAFEKCGTADVNGDHFVDNADLIKFNTDAPELDFNSDGVVNLK